MDDRRGRAAATIEGLSRRTGLDFTGGHGARMVDTVVRCLQDGHGEDVLLDALTVGETYFLREDAHLDLVRRIVAEAGTDRPAQPGLRVWSAGCASGEEAYTIAMVLHELGVLAGSAIIGTDLSPRAVSLARRALYGRWSLRRVHPALLGASFERVGDGFRPRAELRARAEFHVGNILDGPPSEGGFDLVLCRNVLIYLTEEAQAAAAAVFASALAPRGWLITGASDPPLQATGLVRVPVEGVIAHRLVSAAASAPPTAAASPVAPRASRPVPPHPPAPPRSGAPTATAPRRASSDGAAASVPDDALRADRRYDAALRHLLAGEPVAAVAEARAAVYLEPGLVVAHLALAHAEQLAGDHAAARRRLRTAIELLAEVPADAEVPLADGERAESLAAAATARLRVLEGAS